MIDSYTKVDDRRKTDSVKKAVFIRCIGDSSNPSEETNDALTKFRNYPLPCFLVSTDGLRLSISSDDDSNALVKGKTATHFLYYDGESRS